jgi:anti-anti-sigma factor
MLYLPQCSTEGGGLLNKKSSMSIEMVASLIYIADGNDDVDYDSIVFSVMAVDALNTHKSGNMILMLKTLISGGAKKILLDMSELESVDSSGISALLETAKMIKQNHGVLALSNVPHWIQKIFEPFKLDLLINMFDSHDEMIKFFRLY